MSWIAIDLSDETDAAVLLTLSALSVWLAWTYWPAAHDAMARLACV